MTSGHLRAMVALFLGTAKTAACIESLAGTETDALMDPTVDILEQKQMILIFFFELEQSYLFRLQLHIPCHLPTLPSYHEMLEDIVYSKAFREYSGIQNRTILTKIVWGPISYSCSLNCSVVARGLYSFS